VIALKQQTAFQFTERDLPAGRADEAVGPPPLEKSMAALFFGTVVVEKFCQTESGLKLDFVSGHGLVPPVKVWNRLPWQGYHPVIPPKNVPS
jgi:hypothetical protein